MKIKETLIRNAGAKEEYLWDVRKIREGEYECIELNFTFCPETGETSKEKSGEKVYIGKPFQSGSRTITYEIHEEDEKKEKKIENTTPVLVVEWKHPDGSIEEQKTYTGKLWEKGEKKRLYIDRLGKGAYADLDRNILVRGLKEEKLGEWKKRDLRATVESRYILK